MRAPIQFFALFLIILSVSCSPINRKNRIRKTFELATKKLDDAYYDDAIALYTKVLEMDHELVDAYHNRGVAYHETGHYAMALADYNHVRQLRPDYNDVLFNRIYTYMGLERYEMATADLTLLKQIYPDTALVHFIEGLMYGQRNQFEKAISSFSSAATMEPANFDVQTNLGVMNYHLEQYDQAEQHLMKALELRNSAPSALNPLSLVYLKQGFPAKADSTIDVAIGRMANQAFFLNNKGLIQIHLGKYELADSLINASLKIDPENPDAKANLQMLDSIRN